jgi:hypothetical protein
MGRGIPLLLLCAYVAFDGTVFTNKQKQETVCGASVYFITKIIKLHLDRKFFFF